MTCVEKLKEHAVHDPPSMGFWYQFLRFPFGAIAYGYVVLLFGPTLTPYTFT